MSIWFFVWLFLSAFLLYFLGWTLYTLFRQKQAWRVYAEKKKLRYKAEKFLNSPEVTGTVDGYTLHMLVGEHLSSDGRNTRKLTAIEIHLGSKMPMEGIIASGGMVELAHDQALKEEYRPEHPEWSKQYIAVSSSLPALKAYLTNIRLEALTSLMKIKNAWIILIFRGDVTILRLDTPSALENPKKIDALINKLIQSARVLELGVGEDRILKGEAAKTTKEKTLPMSEQDVAAINLQLEDEAVLAMDQPPEENNPVSDS